MIFGVSPRARVGGWVAVLSENKAISASKLKLKLSWDWVWQVFKSCSISLLSRLGGWVGGWVVGWLCYLKIRLSQPQSWSWSWVELSWGWAWQFRHFWKIETPPWVFKCPNLNLRLFCFFSAPLPPLIGKKSAIFPFFNYDASPYKDSWSLDCKLQQVAWLLDQMGKAK